MIRNKFLLASSALAISFFAADAMADGVTSCGDITQIRYMLQKYATNDPSNYCIRATTLAESYPCMREEVLRASNSIAQKNGLASVVVGCPAPVVQAAPPAPVYYQPAPQYVQYQPVQQGYVQPIPQVQTFDRVAGPVIVQGSRVTGSHAGLFAGSALLWGGLGLLAAGGTAAALISSSGSSSSTTTTTTGGTTSTNFITDEYKAQYSLTTMDAASAYQRGFAGAGIQVAVLDTGLDVSHPEFAGRVLPGNGFDFVTNIAGVAGQPAAVNLNSHGTEVAGVIAANRNFIGMHGVAYDASLFPLRVFNSAGGAIADFTNAINKVTASPQVRILNGSYGPDDAWHTNFEPLHYQGIITTPEISEANAYKAFVAAGGILVFPSGNAFLISPGLAANPTGPGFLPFIKPANSALALTNGSNGAYRDENGNILATADYSSLQPNTIVVAGVDKSNVISAFSNRCGVAAAWCMVAPDENIFTTTTGGGYATVSGTSFAAPQVSGAIAILKQEFPNLTAAQIVSRLLTTATDLGAPGVDAIYGHGLLNLAAASNPVGVTGISTTGLINYQSSIADSKLSYGSAFGNSVTSAFNGVNVLVLDSYGAAFVTTLGNRIASTSSAFNTREAVAKFDRPDDRQELSFGDRTHVGFV
ncbi:MAG: S8 family serine peptidase, partial [Alphaproteobacteria bacterium]|nr:S8 family serine peptidase [Alphaproteobacteria bacterium]